MKGFLVVKREKLQALTGDDLERMNRTGELELAHIHLQSLSNFPALVRRMTAENAN